MKGGWLRICSAAGKGNEEGGVSEREVKIERADGKRWSRREKEGARRTNLRISGDVGDPPPKNSKIR